MAVLELLFHGRLHVGNWYLQFLLVFISHMTGHFTWKNLRFLSFVVKGNCVMNSRSLGFLKVFVRETCVGFYDNFFLCGFTAVWLTILSQLRNRLYKLVSWLLVLTLGILFRLFLKYVSIIRDTWNLVYKIRFNALLPLLVAWDIQVASYWASRWLYDTLILIWIFVDVAARLYHFWTYTNRVGSRFNWHYPEALVRTLVWCVFVVDQQDFVSLSFLKISWSFIVLTVLW